MSELIICVSCMQLLRIPLLAFTGLLGGAATAAGFAFGFKPKLPNTSALSSTVDSDAVAEEPRSGSLNAGCAHAYTNNSERPHVRAREGPAAHLGSSCTGFLSFVGLSQLLLV
jgi:hypothetical protein